MKSAGTPLSSGLVLLIAACVAHAGNFLFQILMGRLLGKDQFDEFGVMNTMLNIFGLVAIPASALQLAIARQTAIFDEQGDVDSIAAMIRRATNRLGLVCVLLAAVLLALSPWLIRYLQLKHYEPIFVTAGLIVVAVILPVGSGALQGLKRFGALSVTTVVTPLVRIALGVLLVGLGWKASGALLGTLAGNLAAVAVCAVVLVPFYRRTVSPTAVDTKAVYRYLGPTLVSLIAYAALVNLDLVMVKHYFSPTTAAGYAVASLFGRAIGWLITPLCAVLFPHVWDENQHEANRSLLLKFLLVAVGLSVVGAVVCTLGSGFLTRLMLDRADDEVASLIPLCAWAMLPIGVANLFLNFAMARGRYGFLIVFVAIALLYPVAFALWHETIRQILLVVTASGIVTLGLFVGLTYGTRRARQP